ncbi:hypothetical protein BGW37DRAFT_474844 [Umbelopsis sp. PMI_123]|nr:hypothetical protein BGW37DRAFT_474844 [Umbelopsis sp. PMI_123]
MFSSNKLSTLALIYTVFAGMVNAVPISNDASPAAAVDQGAKYIGRTVAFPDSLSKRDTCPIGYSPCYDSLGGCCPTGSFCQAGSNTCSQGCGIGYVTCADGGCCPLDQYCGGNGFCYSYF